MLLRRHYPSVLGASAPTGNNGSLRTRGWEIGIGWNHSFGDADVYANFNIYDGKTTVTEYRNDAVALSTTSIQVRPMAKSGALKLTVTLKKVILRQGRKGNWTPVDGVANQHALQIGNFKYNSGDIKFADLDGDGFINGGLDGVYRLDGKLYVPKSSLPKGYSGSMFGNFIVVDGEAYDAIVNNKNSERVGTGTLDNHGDLKVIGNAAPRYEYSFRLGGAWKGFDIDMFFQGVGKRDMWSTSAFCNADDSWCRCYLCQYGIVQQDDFRRQ